MRLLTLTVTLAFAFALSAAASARTLNQPRRIDPARTLRLKTLSRHWETVTGIPRARARAPVDSPAGLRFWQRRTRAVLRYSLHPPHLSGWLCIHRYEGSWRDSGDPYWGGLQMDRGFMASYAPRLLLRRGLANAWAPLEQMWVAERAYRSGRGYYAWPNTARFCHLI